MKLIKLTNGMHAQVDDEDYDKLKNYRWYFYKNGNNYYTLTNIKQNGRYVTKQMHVMIMGTPKGMHTDHIDGNGLNNQKSNLRICSCAENTWNSRSIIGSSRYKGVNWHKETRKWQAKICVNRKQIHLGVHSSEKEAALAYNEAAKKHHGKFARLNEI